MVRNGYDDVNGVIIGGDYVSWQLFYDGRPQGQKQSAANDDEAIEMAEQRCKELKVEFGGFPCYLYPDDKWEVRLA